ncbi:MAG: hypothetical protein HY069_00010 [Chlamydiia bacterium]|nr:hypothetical protein [Chlamydiia bacterium]
MQRQENAIKKWWWVITFILCVFGAYIHGIREKKQAIQNLALRLEEMQQEKMARLQEKEELTLQLASFEASAEWQQSCHGSFDEANP